MPKIADLIVNLTLESASFRKEVEASRRDVERLGDQITSSFRTMASVVGISLGALSAGAISGFVKGIVNSADEINKLSQKIGVSVEDLSTLQHALKLSDVPVETFTTGIGLLSKALAGMADEQENKGAALALQALGIKARDASGNLRPVVDVLLDISSKFQSFEDGVGKTNIALQLFGRSGKELIPFLNQGAAGIKKMQEEARAMGLEISGDTAQSAENFNDSLTRIEDRAVGLSREFLEGLVPALDAVSNSFNQAAGSGDGFFKTLGKNVGLYGTGAALGLASALLSLRRASTKDEELKALIDAEQRQLDEAFNKLRKGYGLPTNEPLDTSLVPSHGATAITQKVQPPRLPDLKAIEAAKKYADELARANSALDGIVNKLSGELDPFDKIRADYASTIDDLTKIWNKYPETRARIEDLILQAVKVRDAKILQEEQKTLDETNKLIAKALEQQGPDLKSVPIITPTVKPKLDTSELPSFYAQAVQQLAKFGTDAEKELSKITAVDRIKQSVDELILRTGTAAGGARVFFRQYAQYATDTAQVVHDAFAKIFGALEDQLTNLLAHFKFDFKSLLDTIKESIARAVVQKFILGPIAAALGLAKNDGSTEAQAIWVRMAKNLPSTGKDGSSGGLFGGLLGSIFGGAGGTGTPDGTELNPFHVIVDNQGGGSGDSGDGESGGPLASIQGSLGKIFSGVGSFFAKIGSAILSAFKFIGSAIGGLFGGGFADGGFLGAGQWGIAGENGPEPIFGGRTGVSVIPNHAAFGSHTSNNIVNNFYLSPVRSDPFGYSQSQLANAVFTGNMRAMSRA
jgi:hypothetical protein